MADTAGGGSVTPKATAPGPKPAQAPDAAVRSVTPKIASFQPTTGTAPTPAPAPDAAVRSATPKNESRAGDHFSNVDRPQKAEAVKLFLIELCSSLVSL